MIGHRTPTGVLFQGEFDLKINRVELHAPTHRLLTEIMLPSIQVVQELAKQGSLEGDLTPICFDVSGWRY